MIHKSGFDLSQAKKSFMKRGKVKKKIQIFAIRQSHNFKKKMRIRLLIALLRLWGE